MACTTPHAEIDGDIDIYPLPHLKVKKDLIGDLDGLYKQYQSIEPWLKSNSNSETNEIIQSKEERAKLEAQVRQLQLDMLTLKANPPQNPKTSSEFKVD